MENLKNLIIELKRQKEVFKDIISEALFTAPDYDERCRLAYLLEVKFYGQDHIIPDLEKHEKEEIYEMFIKILNKISSIRTDEYEEIEDCLSMIPPKYETRLIKRIIPKEKE